MSKKCATEKLLEMIAKKIRKKSDGAPKESEKNLIISADWHLVLVAPSDEVVKNCNIG